MSIIYCEKHDLRWDSDFKSECPACESEPTIAELAQEIVSHSDAMLRRGLSPHLYGTDRVTHVEPLAREVLRLAKLASELDPLDVYEKTIEIEKHWKQRAEKAEADMIKARDTALEDAAKVCEVIIHVPHGDGSYAGMFRHFGNQQCAAAIRAMRSKP